VVRSLESSLAAKLLPGALSIAAGSLDVISFLRLGGLFAAHITGNLVILASHLVTGRAAPLSQILSVPIFIMALALTRLAAGGLEESGRDSLKPLLTLHFVLLTSVLAICVSAGSGLDSASPTAVFAGMVGSSRDGGAERPRADLVDWGAGDRGHDNRRHGHGHGCGRDAVSARP
jgi:uncharacterized membrane protein YoaK (UPF0700 family)